MKEYAIHLVQLARLGIERSMFRTIQWTTTTVLLALFASAAVEVNIVRAADHASILLYHRFGEARYPSANTTLAQLKAHLGELTSKKYPVRPLTEIITAFESGTALPDRVVAITVDDAFISFFRKGWPLIKRSRLPITLFIATDAIDQGNPDYMSWDQNRELARAGVTIGSQSRTHPHLPATSAAKLAEELSYSNQRFFNELGTRPQLIAYPYGECGLREKVAAAKAGFVAGFGQHSGVAHSGGDRFGLPRFSMSEKYGGLDRFHLIANALPLVVQDFEPLETVLHKIKPPANPPPMRFNLPSSMGSITGLRCFASSQIGQLPLRRLGNRAVAVILS